MLRPKKSEKVLKKTIFTAKSVNETEKVEFLRNSSEFMDFFGLSKSEYPLAH